MRWRTSQYQRSSFIPAEISASLVYPRIPITRHGRHFLDLYLLVPSISLKSYFPILISISSCIPMKYSNPRISALLQILKFFSERPYPFFLPFYIFPFRCQQYIFLKFFRCCINLFYIFMNPKDGSCPRKLV